MNNNIEDLKRAIEKFHNCVASNIEEVKIIEKFGNKTVWKGVVHVFNIEGNPKSDTCYAWSSLIEKSNKRRYYTVLKIHPIDSPEKAVRAAITNDYKKINEGLNEKK